MKFNIKKVAAAFLSVAMLTTSSALSFLFLHSRREACLNHDLDRDLETFHDEIAELLSIEIVKRYYYQKGEIIESIKNDKDLKEACRILGNKSRYDEILNLSGKH